MAPPLLVVPLYPTAAPQVELLPRAATGPAADEPEPPPFDFPVNDDAVVCSDGSPTTRPSAAPRGRSYGGGPGRGPRWARLARVSRPRSATKLLQWCGSRVRRCRRRWSTRLCLRRRRRGGFLRRWRQAVVGRRRRRLVAAIARAVADAKVDAGAHGGRSATRSWSLLARFMATSLQLAC